MSKTNQNKTRMRYERFFAPFGKFISKTGISANQISLLAVFVSMLSCFGYTLGGFYGLLVGTFLLGTSSILDMLDGSVARATETTGYYGALLDRVLDRIAEWFFLLGIMLGGYAKSWIVFFCFGGMILASYVRSTAEGRGDLKMDSSKGIFERKEKLSLLTIGCFIEAILIVIEFLWPLTFSLLDFVILFIGGASTISAIQRLLFAKNFYQSKGN